MSRHLLNDASQIIWTFYLGRAAQADFALQGIVKPESLDQVDDRSFAGRVKFA